MTAISIEPLTSAVGGEVHDIDVERLRDDDELPAAVLEALEQVGVLVFPDLHVDPQTQVAFCRKLGAVETGLTRNHEVEPGRRT